MLLKLKESLPTILLIPVLTCACTHARRLWSRSEPLHLPLQVPQLPLATDRKLRTRAVPHTAPWRKKQIVAQIRWAGGHRRQCPCGSIHWGRLTETLNLCFLHASVIYIVPFLRLRTRGPPNNAVILTGITISIHSPQATAHGARPNARLTCHCLRNTCRAFTWWDDPSLAACS